MIPELDTSFTIKYLKQMSNIIVTGGAGFIGSHLCRHLIANGNDVIAVDNLSTESQELIADLLLNDKFTFIEADVFDDVKMQSIFKHNSVEMVYQLVANTSVQKGGYSPNIDIKETLSSTLEVLKHVVQFGVKKFVYISSSTVYGCMDEVMRESSAHLQPISFYGAAKLAGEAFASAYSSMYDIQMWVVRLSNVVGADATHGIVHDIKKKLALDTKELHLLGDGTQAKPFIHVDDAIDGILHAVDRINDKYNVIQVGNEKQITIREVAELILKSKHLDTKIVFSENAKTWAGDVERYRYDVTKLRSLGWAPKWSTEEAILHSID